jgi:hypothetical protein
MAYAVETVGASLLAMAFFQALSFFGLGTYPLLWVLRLAVSPDGDSLFYKRQKK